MKKLVIFDLDGTLADTLASIAYCTNRALEKSGFSPISSDKVRRFVGNGARTQVIRSLREAGDTESAWIPGYTDDDGYHTVPLHLEEVLNTYMEYFKADCMYQVMPYPGIRQLLQDLKEREIFLAVFSNKPHNNTLQVVELLFGTEVFDAIQGQVEHIRKKPAPDGVFEVLDQIGRQCAEPLKMEEVLYVGDSGVDMQTGKAAGAYTVGVLWGFRDAGELEECGADHLITEPGELMGLL